MQLRILPSQSSCLNLSDSRQNRHVLDSVPRSAKPLMTAAPKLFLGLHLVTPERQSTAESKYFYCSFFAQDFKSCLTLHSGEQQVELILNLGLKLVK